MPSFDILFPEMQTPKESYTLSPYLMKTTSPEVVKENLLRNWNRIAADPYGPDRARYDSYIGEIVYELRGLIDFSLLSKEITRCIEKHRGVMLSDNNVNMIAIELSCVIRLHIGHAITK